MDNRIPIFMEDVPDYIVKAGRMHIVWRDLEVVLPMHVMLAGIAKAQRALDDWHERQSQPVVRFPSREH